jgi:large subunit ribosomal protein L24
MKISKPSTQRRRLYQTPLHQRSKLFSSPLSKKLKESHGTRSVSLRTGDTVRVLRGEYKGFEGKITRINRKKTRVFVEAVTREKVDGNTIFIPIHPSKVMITSLNLDDKKRKESLERKNVKKETKVKKRTSRRKKRKKQSKNS